MDVMIDIETLSLQSDALILSIGAVEFTCDGDNGPTFGEQILIVPDLKDQILAGRHIDRGTQIWWKNQPFEAQDHWMNVASPIALSAALTRLGDYLHTRSPTCIWANGIVFDIGVLENAYRACLGQIPWKYNIIRDARTFYAMAPSSREFVPSTDEAPLQVAHHPISDCKQQIIRLWEHGYSK